MITQRLRRSFLALLLLSPGMSCAQDGRVEVRVVKKEVVSPVEVRFRVTVTNRSHRVIFLPGINYKSGPVLYPVYLERWDENEWNPVLPCVDSAPPDAIRLNEGDSKSLDLNLKIPLEGACKKREMQLEGKFRFRVDYFQTDSQLNNYLRHFFDRDQKATNRRVAVSASFELLPPT